MPLRHGSYPASLGVGAAPWRAESGVESLLQEPWPVSTAFLGTQLNSSLGSLAQAWLSRNCACPVEPCLFEQRFLAVPGNGGALWLHEA